MIILNNSTLNANTNKDDLLNYFTDNILNTYELSYVPFHELINSEKEEKKHKKSFQDKRLNKLVPNIHKSYVHWIIKNQFDNNEQAYIETIPLFFEKFTGNNKKICDDGIFLENKRYRKNLNKKKRHLILYSSQLLKLIGFNRSKITTNAIVKSYREEMELQDEYLKSFRLVSADGKIRKLVTNEQKQKERMAQILKISKCIEDIAKDKKFTFSFVTLTLPPSFHPNPLNNNCSYSDATPQEAINQLNTYWKFIRARLSNLGLKFGENLFGIQVIECQADSTLHLHCCLWHSKEDTDNIHSEIRIVQNRSKEYVKFDIQLNNGKTKASSYLFKYVLKTHTNYKDNQLDDNAIRNMACRNLYGIRSFNFFGLKGSITKFNFLCKNYINYKKYLSKEIRYCLQQGDLYDFITNYEMYFENSYIRENGLKKHLGVIFKKGHYDFDGQMLKQKDIVKYNEVVFIDNRQYCVFEKTYEEEIKYIRNIDLSLPDFVNVKASYDKVCLKQAFYDNEVNNVIQSLGFQRIDTKKNKDISNSVQLFNIIQEKPCPKGYDLRKDEYDLVFLEETS